MDLPKTIAIFLTLSAVLMFLFCLLIRYFSRKLKRERREVVAIDQKDEFTDRQNGTVVQGAYQEFLQRRKLSRQIEMKEISMENNNLIQTSQLRQLLDISNDIYGMTKLRQRLQNDIIPLQVSAESSRSAPSIKSFHISRLNTAQSQQHQSYNYLYKLVSYDMTGLTVIEVEAKSLKKMEDGEWQLTKEVSQNAISYESQKFIDEIQSNGFQINQYGYYKYINSINTTNFKEMGNIKNTKVNSKKEPITQQQFKKERAKLLEEDKKILEKDDMGSSQFVD